MISAGRPAVVLTSPRTEGLEAVSRRVGELASKQTRGGNPGGAPHALNDLDSHPWSATPVAPMGRDTCASPGAIPEPRPAGGVGLISPSQLVGSVLSASGSSASESSSRSALPGW